MRGEGQQKRQANNLSIKLFRCQSLLDQEYACICVDHVSRMTSLQLQILAVSSCCSAYVSNCRV